MNEEHLQEAEEYEEISEWYPTLTEQFEYNGMSISDFI
jgi:hypothetical protein